MLAPDARFAVQASLDLYSRILDVVERNGYDNFNKRAYTTKLEKLSILPGSWLAANTPAPAAAPRAVRAMEEQQQ
jgi:phytoene synthase